MPSNYVSNRNWRPIEATMIQGSNVNIGCAQLNMTNHQINEATVQGGRYALDLLRSNCSLAALLDSIERYDPPRCAEETRLGVMQKMEDWFHHDYDSHHDDAQSSILWLYGGAGAGKSALAQTLAEKFRAKQDLAASFFFFKADVNRNNGNHLIPTLALQFLQSFPEITPFVKEKILANPDLFKKNRQTQMFALLLDPLKNLSLEEVDGTQPNTDTKSYPRLVVIDGLDECIDPDIQCDLLRIIASAIPHLPYSLRFLITSRPESHITRVFQHDLKNVARYNLSDDSDADMDIRNLLEGEFEKIRRTHPLQQHLTSQWPPSGSINSIVERSSGHFIYASTVMRFIQSPRHRPDDRLEVILGLKQPHEQDQPFARLDSLYTLIFLEIQDPGQLEKIHRALGIMHLQSLKSGLFRWWESISNRRAIEALLKLRPGDLILLFDGLLSLVTFENDDIRIFHKSLFDYLLDSSRSGDLQLDLGLAHESAADYILMGEMPWSSEEFEIFAYHCQFARLNHKLAHHLRSLACNPTTTPAHSSSRLLRPSIRISLLQSILYFLQAICRQDFDSSGNCYRKYVERQTQCLRCAVPSSQRLKCMISRLTLVRRSAYIERNLRSSFTEFFVLKDAQWRGTKGFNRKVPIPAVKMSVIQLIRREHEMFSSYVKARHRYPNIVVSFLEPSVTDLIHSCHFVIRATPTLPSVTFVMLVTYTANGVRLSCSEFKGVMSLHHSLRGKIGSLVEKHCRRTQNVVDDDMTVVYTTSIARHLSP